MKLFSAIIALLTICCNGSLFAQSDFEGTLTTRVTMAGVDLSLVTEKIDYEKGNIQEQLEALYKTIPAQDIARMQAMMVYEMVSVNKAPISDGMLVPKKTEPLYELTDMNYGMKLLGIMMGGMAAMGDNDDWENE